MQDRTEGQDAGQTDGSGDDHSETRSQRAGEGGTTRFGMEDGDNTDVPATGGADLGHEDAEQPPE